MSFDAHVASNGDAAPLDASKLTYTFTDSPRPVPKDNAEACSSTETICSDHMVTVEWDVQKGWGTPELKPYGPFSLMPTASVLHYATECFEGMKAYRGNDGKLRLFRPDCNARRMLVSAERVGLPEFAPEQLEKLIIALLSVDGAKWLPRDDEENWPRGASYLYIRPTMIGTQAELGVKTPGKALLYVLATYLPKLDTPQGGLRLHTSPEDQVRAWVGGFGYAKLGANYGPSLKATNEARALGYHQTLWLYGADNECTEAGASNFFIIWQPKDAGKLPQLVTAPLDNRLILDGVTRRSILQLARERLADQLEVVERIYTISEVQEALAEGRLLESFAAGTAYFVCPVSLVHHRDQDIPFPMTTPEGSNFTVELKKMMGDIMYGNVDHPWGVVVPEKQDKVHKA